MQADLPRALGLLALLVPVVMSAKPPQVTVEDTGSTNRPGLRVIFNHEGRATVERARSESGSGETQHVSLPEELCKQFMNDLKAAGPLNELPPVHCVKSVSFGSRTFVEFNGNRSPDLSCPAADDPRSRALQKDSNDILQAAREAANIPSSRRIFTLPVPAPHPQ